MSSAVATPIYLSLVNQDVRTGTIVCITRNCRNNEDTEKMSEVMNRTGLQTADCMQ